MPCRPQPPLVDRQWRLLLAGHQFRNGQLVLEDTPRVAQAVGATDRYEWKLVGKKEVYIPYNNYTQQFVTPSSHTATPMRASPTSSPRRSGSTWTT